MRGEERRQARRITARHAALGSDAVHADVAAGRREAGRVALRVVISHIVTPGPPPAAVADQLARVLSPFLTEKRGLAESRRSHV